MGLHKRYTALIKDHEAAFSKGMDKEVQEKITRMFDDMMKALYRQEGASLDISILESPEAQGFIDTHAAVLDSPSKRRRCPQSCATDSGTPTTCSPA